LHFRSITILVTSLIVGIIFYWVWVSSPAVPKLGEFQELQNLSLSQKEFKDVSGKAFRLSDFKGKLIILHSWASWCQPCLEEIPQMLEFCKKFENQGVVLIALQREPIKGNGVIEGLPVYFDSGNKLAQDMMMIGGIPSTLFISPSGKPEFIVLGKVLWNSDKLLKKIQEMLTK
jgi:thiol-disulfide isomerase/thioredoxin